MNSQNDKHNELQRREKELEERERSLRLRELEAEIYQREKAQDPPLYETRKDNPPDSKLKRWGRKLANVGKFLAVVIGVVVTMRIAYWLALMVMVTGIGWISYKIFLESDRPKD
ncbi:MAG: DUF962 domain-containing protein [Moorea sp. SIO2B7]|nr:DUF962 domain-containing protein [Moorena sp. SIO2B7]